MKFKLYLQNKKNDEKEVIKFLNSSAEKFYLEKNAYAEKSFGIVLKSVFLSSIIELERTIRGTFDCDLNLTNIDISLLRNMFPHAVNMFNVSNDDLISKISHFLTLFRNMNAHALISKSDLEFFKIDYSFLEFETVFDERIKYYDNEITIAGVIFLLLNFLREESIANLCKKSFIFGLISCGKFRMDTGEQFVAKISRVNLELSIRQDNAKIIMDAVVGNYKEKLKVFENSFVVAVGSDNYPTYKVSGSLNGEILKINSGSLTKTFYKEDFQLNIIDRESFVELSNQLPPFVLVDFLYNIGVDKFDNDVANTIKTKYKFISKLNKPKFYIDKNLSVLLMPSEISDFRIISAVCRYTIGTILLGVENYIYKSFKIKRCNKYSTIGTALAYLNISDSTHKNVKYLRNFVLHGYMLNEFMLYKKERKQFTIKFIINTLKSMIDECSSNEKLKGYILWILKKYLITTLIHAKYKVVIDFTRKTMLDYSKIDMNDFARKIGFINNSMFDICDFNCLVDFNFKCNKVIKISVPNLKECLYLSNSEDDIKLLNRFCKKEGYRIDEKQDNGLLIDYKLV